MAKFRVALSGDFRKPDGSPAFPMFDLSPLLDDPQIEVGWVAPVDGAMPAEGLEGYDALILLVPQFDARSVPSDGRLAVVARFGVGYDTVDLDVCNDNAIACVITPDGVRRPVAVSIITFLLALSGKMMVKDRLARGGPEGWAKRIDNMGVGITGKKLGQLGIGNIGAEVFRLAQPFGMEFIAHDPFADPDMARELGIRLVSLEDLFRESDFLSISVPLTPETRHIVNAERLKLMKPSAYLINTARGPVVDQKALAEALAAGTIAGAGLDVFEEEPAPADDPIFQLDNVICAPHSLCWTDECFAGIGAADVRAVKDIMQGRTPAGLVNRGVVENPAFRAKLDRLAEQFGG